MSEQDPIMERITEGFERGRGGDPGGARAILAEVWDQLGPSGDPLHVVSLAHYMADLQDNPGDELEWDLRALAAADALTDGRAQRFHASLTVRGLLPSLYLNIAADYEKLDDLGTARTYLTKAEAVLPDVPGGEYGEHIRAAIGSLRERVGTLDS